MTGYKIVKIPSLLADLIDRLVGDGEYSSRAEYVKEVIWNNLRNRGFIGGDCVSN